MAPAPSSLTVASVEKLLPLLSASALRLIDARNPALHEIERIRGSVLPKCLDSLAGGSVVVYDAGATGLNQHFAHAVRLANQIIHACPIGTSVILLVGGLAAVREHAPYLIEAGDYVSKKLPKWARQALAVVREEARPPGQVLPWLYVGAIRHATDPEWLALRRVTHVLTVCDVPVKKLPNVRYRFIRAKDMPDFPLGSCFKTCVEFLHSVKKAHGTCLVHCTAGASRSVAVVAAFLIWNGLSAKEAIAKVKTVRTAADPNSGFLKQLDRWESRVRKGLTDHDESDDDEVREVQPEDCYRAHLPMSSSPVSPNDAGETMKGEWAVVEYSPVPSLDLSEPAVRWEFEAEQDPR